MTLNPRSSLLITYETWKALFLREAISRLATERNAIWILLDPIINIIVMLIMFSVIRVLKIGGIDTSVWIIVGVLSYNTFKNTMNSSRNAMNANRVLFTYRQIKPVDVVLIKASIEFLLTILVTLILFTGMTLFGIDILPSDPLAVLIAVFGLWLIGLATTLILSVVEHIVPETAKITALIMTPLYMCSGVIFPLNIIPTAFREWLMLNPLLHAVEAARLGFSPYYHAVFELSMGYVYSFAAVFLFLGLALQLRFRNRLMLE